MGDKVNDGGSAFPVNTANVNNPGACFADNGMSLRDYFAAKALQAWITNTKATSEALKECHGDGVRAREWVAHTCYQFADAMIEARRL